MKRQVFFSFHYENDAMRVQQIRNMGILEGEKKVSPNEWETIKNTGDKNIKKWIDENMRYRSCIVVLIGEKTAQQKWVKYEIKKAWENRKPIFGIYTHHLKCPRTGICIKGENPFERFLLKDGRTLADILKCYDPDPENAYKDIKDHIQLWIEDAIVQSKTQLRVVKSTLPSKEIKLKVA